MLQFGNLVFVILLIYNQLMLHSPLPSALGIVSKKKPLEDSDYVCF
jgi:hypothetical protein